ncbi:isoleucine--tRNA ligase [Simkania negevensis]|uniref:Isoleucine--tRNA ligase n=1 Tax=Simkania negevensis (strain ATCC VR-1471 / DSM 27360 / Z) TaxID=331113 RepID=F8L9E7_SIMNZ|nr:isoleucine--tRNA ligase [Simkania negevensis]CCB89477.1 isoleucyl-tRNA synthetase [Simkania negevensis Z]
MFENRKESFPEREERILEGWLKNKVFQASLKQREKRPLFAFYDGPPFATGLPHYGHMLAGTIKDVVLRYKTMKGYYVPRRFGWDCHGLPVENEIETTYELSKGTSIEQFGIAKFNEECRSIVLRYTKEWERTVNRMGRWIEFKNPYRTMDPTFMETIWWVFGQLWDKDLVYEGFKVMPFSAQLGTPLSNFEANLNYRDVDDPSLIVKFPLVDEPNTFLLVWTTTPWTLPSNLAVTVNDTITYVKVKDKATGDHYVVSKGRLQAYFKDEATYEVVETFKGGKLKGKRYHPLFDYFVNQASPNAFTVIEDAFVEEEDGTGIVHTAPAFGEADFFVCKKEGIELVCPVDQHGKFTNEVPEYEGQFVKDADKDIIRRLKEKKLIFHHGQIRHRYPFCWRSDTPLIYKAVHTWFVSVETIKDRLVEMNKQIHWVPGHIKDGRFGKWLENARDWAISRNRYWGTPIPVWRSNDGDCVVITSIKELEKRTGKKIDDLHRHHIDQLTFEEHGKVYMRIPEVFDCWFESGSMPYAQNHFPFENEKETMDAFPADFIAEGLDQTRCWFYTLNILSTALFDKPAFKNVIVNGIVLAEDGAKMSKRLRNYPDPEIVFNKYGADAVRLYLLHSPAVQADDLRFSEKGVELVLRQFLIPLWNSYIFLATYADIYKWKPSEQTFNVPKADIDRWILSLLQKLVRDVEEGMDDYALSRAVDPFVDFIDQLTNWYIRRCRNRFWADEDTPDRREAFETLHTVLKELSKIAASYVPFISDAIFQNLRTKQDPESVHLADFPTYNSSLRDEKLEKEMGLVQAAVSMGHALRKEHKLKVRQPLGKAHLVSADEETLRLLQGQQQLVMEELNVKGIQFHSKETEFVSLSIKPNFRTLGKRLGPLMKLMTGVVDSFDDAQVKTLLGGGEVAVYLEGESITLTSDDVLIERQVKEGMVAATKEDVTIALDTSLTPELLEEGLMREIVNKLNTQRRSEGLEVTDRIRIRIDSTPKVKSCFEKFSEIISHEVLASQVLFEKTEGTEWDLNGEKAIIHIEKVKK